jgi:hypothetical protein
LRASHISTESVSSSSARKAAARRARRALDIYVGRSRPTLKELAYLGGFPVAYLYQMRHRRKHNGGGRRHNGGAQSIPNGKPASTLADMLVSATPSERIEAAAKLGVATVWDTMIAPLIDEERAAQTAE